MMPKNLAYSSGLNGATFLMFELKQVIKLKLIGLSDKEIRQKAQEENVFQFNNIGRTNRILPTLMRRAKVIDSFLGEALLERTVEMSKMINLYAIMKTDLIFYEFMDEVIGERFRDHNPYLEKKDINIFFSDKAEQSEIVANWSDINQEKLKRGMLTVLFESGILIKRQGQEIKSLMIDDDVKQHLINLGDQKYVEAMGDFVL